MRLPNTDIYLYIIYPIIVVLVSALLIYVINFIKNKIKEKNKNLLKNKLLCEYKGKHKLFFEINTPNTYLIFSFIIVNNSNATLIIKNISASIGGIVGELIKEKSIKELQYQSDKKKAFIIGSVVTFPFTLMPNTPKTYNLTYLFTTPKIIYGKFDIKIETSEGELIMPLVIDVQTK